MRDISTFLSDRIRQLYKQQVEHVKQVRLSDILRQADGYFLTFKRVALIDQFVREGIDRAMFPTQQKLFHRLLEDLSLFVCERTHGGWESSFTGIDLEFRAGKTQYLVSVKSGPNWGNSRQVAALKRDFSTAKRILRTNAPERNVVAVCGCCYGRDNKPDKGEYLKLCGQRFWEFISGNKNLYTEIIEPLGHRAKERDEEFAVAYAQIINRFTMGFAKDFCEEDGKINWEKLVRFNSSEKTTALS
jgi:hypothetical protein